MLEIDIQKGFSEDDLDLIQATLSAGGVAVLPTDTIYGLHCLAENEKAIRKIIKIKKRPDGFGFVHIMKSYCMVHDYCFVSSGQNKYLRTIWPATTRELHNFKIRAKKRPTTVLLKSRNNLPLIGRGVSDALAVRLPQHEFLMQVLKRLNKPLLSSSLNISGQAPIDLKDIKNKLKTKPDLVVNSGKLAKKRASRLLDIRNTDKIKVIRK